jgi:hypothetical protein
LLYALGTIAHRRKIGKRGNKVAEQAKDYDEIEQPESYAEKHVKDEDTIEDMKRIDFFNLG